jgi:hypothetical protein
MHIVIVAILKAYATETQYMLFAAVRALAKAACRFSFFVEFVDVKFL